MNAKTIKSVCKIFIIFMLFATGCWDRTEINDIALITASAYDLVPEGGIRYTIQLMLPSAGGAKSGQGSSGGSKKTDFIVETAVGADVGEAEKNIQKRFPRKLFRGHRRVIVIGEDLARNGMREILDSVSRDPQNRLRTNVLVAEGISGCDLLKIDYPLERVPAEAMREMTQIGIGIEANIRDFLIAKSSQGIQPIGVSISPRNNKEGFDETGIAVFKDMQLAGYLKGEEIEGYLWVTGKFKNSTITTTVPGKEGTIRINVKSTDAKITPEIEGNKVSIYIDLKGEGSVYGNSTQLDLSIPKNILLAQEAIKEKIKNIVQNTVQLAQKEYKSDIFGFGSIISQHNAKEWKLLRESWDDAFSDVKVFVSTDFKIRTSGMSGLPLYLDESEGDGK